MILFARDSSVPQADALQQLDGLASRLANHLANSHADQDAVIVITGHTSRRGSQVYNQELSERRANYIADYL